MSGLAGIFKFDPRDHVDSKELIELALGIDRIGPDGGAEQLTKSVGMIFRAFHTTPESHHEVQPLVRRGSVLAWDGRLDNREEIRLKVGRDNGELLTDADLVFGAYEEWGTRCFAELIGDWALALWDQVNEQLILARDYIGVRRLFYRLDEGSVVWCTTLEPLVLTAPMKLHLDLDYFAGCFYPRPPVETTPYLEIRSVVPASFLTFRYGGKQVTERYWSLNPHARIRYSTDSEYEAHFREVFRESVNRRLRADRTVLAELSGGLDSSSIVCMADEILKDDPGPAIETLSYYDLDEPSGDERPYFTLIEQKRGRTGHHISISDFTRQTAQEALAPLPEDRFVASPGNFRRSLRWDSVIAEFQSKFGARVILSGLGGDEVLGGVQYEAPELADYLLSGRLIAFFQSALRWSLMRKKTIYGLIADTFALIQASYHPESFLKVLVPPVPWTLLKPVVHHSAFCSFSDWRQISPAQLCMEAARYGLAQQLSCTDPLLTGCIEKRYPYLDRTLFAFLASIPRTQILQPGRRRHLMRHALRGIVPHQVLDRKTKSFGFRNSVAVFRELENRVDALFRGGWLTDGLIVNASLLREHLIAVQRGAPENGMALRSALGIEYWLRSMLRCGVIDLTSKTMRCHPAFERTAPVA